MELCDVCSQLILWPEKVRPQALGPYDEILEKSQRLGPGRSGCGGCAFFCTVLHNSGKWQFRVSELSGHVVFLTSMRLDVRLPEKAKGSTYGTDDLLFDVCTEEDISGVFIPSFI
jgi:hypothetical protein